MVTEENMFGCRKGTLVRESEWMRVYKTDRGYLHDSKFLTDDLEIPAESIAGRWSKLSFDERLEFAQAFSAKPKLTIEDDLIVEFLMDRGDFYIWSTIAILLPRYRDRERALAFLVERIGEEHEQKANFFQALGLLNDKKSLPALRAAYDNYRRAFAASSGTGTSADYRDYLHCCAALWRISGSVEYKQDIEDALRSEDRFVRTTAELLLRKS